MNSDIEIEIGASAEDGTFAVKVLHSAGAGRPVGRLDLDPGEILLRRKDLENTILASAVPRRRITPATEAPIRDVGRRLFESLFTGAVNGAYRASLGAVRQRDKRLRVVLHLTAPALAALPWESLFDPETEAYVCQTEPLVRFVEAPYTPEPLAVEPPLRILGLVASPRGLPALDVDAERRNLEKALARPVAEGRVHLTWAPDASWEAVHDLMLDGEWHVLHFIGHGDYDPETDEGYIALTGDDGRVHRVEASRLTALLSEADPTPRLVVLNSCSSGEGGDLDLFSGTAAALVHRGIGAVAAMQFAISDAAAIRFSRGFYAAIARGRAVDEAVRSGRIEILAARDTLEWITPVLYVRGGATRLFTFSEPLAPARAPGAGHRPAAGSPTPPPAPTPPAPAPAPSRATLRMMLIQARAELRVGHHDTAIRLLEDLLALDAADPDAAELLDRARHGKRIADGYRRAVDAEAASDWAAAIAAYDEVLGLDPDHPDAAARRDGCRHQQQIGDHVEEMRYHHAAGSWQAVVDVDAELAALDPAAADPDGLATDARRRLGVTADDAEDADAESAGAPPHRHRHAAGTTTASRGRPEIASVSGVLLDKIAPSSAEVVGDIVYALRQPRPGSTELVRLDLTTGEVTARVDVSGTMVLHAASPGGVIVADTARGATVYDDLLRPIGRWDLEKTDAAVIDVVATGKFGWVLAAEDDEEVFPRLSKGRRMSTQLVRLDLLSGASEAVALGSDTFWQEPDLFRGLQLSPTYDGDFAEVVALRCEWTAGGFTVTKRKVASFAREDRDDVPSHPAGTYTWSTPHPDLRQVLRWNGRLLLAQVSTPNTKSRAAVCSDETQLEAPTVLREFDMSSVQWIPHPDAPVLVVSGGEPPQTEVWRLVGDGGELRHVATTPGVATAELRWLYDVTRENRIMAAIAGDRLWWGTTSPDGLACLDPVDGVLRIEHTETCGMLAADGDDRLHVLVNAPDEQDGQELRTIHLRWTET